MSVYDAHPLALGESTNIRLIELLHNSMPSLTSHISCRLFVVPFKEAPSYTALSYVWGPENPTMKIHVDDHEFVVRKNLWDFLWQCRLSGFKNYLWIDALCIDQTSIKERNHQVALMRHIYTGASYVIAWLGQDVDQNFRTVVEMSRMSTQWDLTLPKEEHSTFIKRIAQVLNNSYWERLWVVQEFAIARVVELWSGDSQIGCKTFAEMLVPLQRMSDDPVDYPKVSSILYRTKASGMLYYRWLYHARRAGASTPETLCSTDIFTTFDTSLCVDVRDRVYGLLGLIDEQELKDFPIVVDYSQQPYELFVQLWERYLKLSENKRKSGGLPNGNDMSVATHFRDMLHISPDDWERSTVGSYFHQKGSWIGIKITGVPISDQVLASMS
ncbi:HET domain-containing protein [Stagonosporopsis vannaccii]|nr:HET domain-containing protein [Stagonosporopsis vannaccii]